MATVSRFPLPKPEISRFLCIFFLNYSPPRLTALLLFNIFYPLMFCRKCYHFHFDFKHWYRRSLNCSILNRQECIKWFLRIYYQHRILSFLSENIPKTASNLEDKWTSPEKPETRETFSLLSKSYWMIFGFRYNDLFKAIYTWWEIKKTSRCHS